MTCPAPPHREAGFSLVEMLAVVAIIAMMSAVVMLSVTGRPALIETEAERLLARFHEAGETALVTGEVIGFATEADGTGYLFLRYRDGRWRDMPDHPALAPHRLPEGIAIYGESGRGSRGTGPDPQDVPLAPLAWFDPTGIDAPFRLLLQGAERDLHLVRNGAGQLSIEDREGAR